MTVRSPSRRLDNQTLALGVAELIEVDKDLAAVVTRYGSPPLWGRRPGFETLVRIILEQQVSLASARAVFRRLKNQLGSITPDRVSRCGIRGLRRAGFTGQKAGYCHGLAKELMTGRLDLHEIARAADADAREQLLSIRGVGPWTADVYRLMALRRPDVWPDGDVALAESARIVKRLRQRPSIERLRAIARRWRPWRSVAARILWHNYLSSKTAPNA